MSSKKSPKIESPKTYEEKLESLSIRSLELQLVSTNNVTQGQVLIETHLARLETLKHHIIQDIQVTKQQYEEKKSDIQVQTNQSRIASLFGKNKPEQLATRLHQLEHKHGRLVQSYQRLIARIDTDLITVNSKQQLLPREVTELAIKPPVNYRKYIQSIEWKEKAEEAKARAGNRCAVCNRSRAEVQLDAHHRTYDRLGNEKAEDITILCRDCHQLYEDAKQSQTKKTRKTPQRSKKSTTTKDIGHCIRCSQDIPINPSAPYCKSCYRSWVRYKNDDYIEKQCHICGKDHETTKVKPVCYSCYKRHKALFSA